MKHANRYLRRLGGALGPALLLALLAAGCGDDASGKDVPDAAERDGAPTTDARLPGDATVPDADPDAPDASGDICGGFSGRQCEGETYCDYKDNDCGANDGTGVCMPRPDACSPVQMPVCGCDGQTHPNECEANLAGTDVSRDGNCVR